MKKLIFTLILVSIIPIMVLFSCSSASNSLIWQETGGGSISTADISTIDSKINDSKHRIILKEKLFSAGTEFYIIEVDGHEYLSQYNGGICPLVLDSNTQNK